jgi:hypothetical protein
MRNCRRGGGGNITGFDIMWVSGRVQPEVAHAAVGFGVYASTAKQSWRSVNEDFGPRAP